MGRSFPLKNHRTKKSHTKKIHPLKSPPAAGRDFHLWLYEWHTTFIFTWLLSRIHNFFQVPVLLSPGGKSMSSEFCFDKKNWKNSRAKRKNWKSELLSFIHRKSTSSELWHGILPFIKGKKKKLKIRATEFHSEEVYVKWSLTRNNVFNKGQKEKFENQSYWVSWLKFKLSTSWTSP